eukprot:GHVP01039815.1.p1 GENE.GHVP01039815.1~~GHVP01039815.1.p1  ORF type:complete len:129 (+),score=19.91 GHVP01039815.1:2-388(+)
MEGKADLSSTIGSFDLLPVPFRQKVSTEASGPSSSTSETEAGTSSHLTKSVGAVSGMPTERAVEFRVHQNQFSTELPNATKTRMTEDEKESLYKEEVLSTIDSKKLDGSWRVCGKEHQVTVTLQPEGD